MKLIEKDAAWDLFLQRKASVGVPRAAFLAALLMDRVRTTSGALSPFLAANYAAEFIRMAVPIHSLCVAACNYELSAVQEKRLSNLQERFAKLANALGFDSRTGGDPRGPCAYLIDPDDRKGDGWGEGWAVYK